MKLSNIADELCMGCMMPNPSGGKCSYCSYEDTGIQLKPFLPVKSPVADKYIVGKVLYSTAESVTYIGWDVASQSASFITEFLPEALCVRLDNNEIQPIAGSEGSFDKAYNNFLDLWRTLARLRELSAISPVYDIVEDYGTVYVVSEYEESVSLREFLLKWPGGRMSWEEARKLFMPMLSTLDELHRYGVYHCGITTSTLRICRDGRLRIFGFATKQARMAGTELNASLPTGFAAIEQYTGESPIGAGADIYAVCACIYRTIAGVAPASAQERLIDERVIIPASVSDSIPVFVVRALELGLAVDSDERLQSVSDLRKELSGSPVIGLAQENSIGTPDGQYQLQEQRRIKSVTVKAKGKKNSSKRAVVITVCIMLVIFIAAAVALAMTVFRGQIEEFLDNKGLLGGEAVTTEYTTTEDMVAVPDFIINKATRTSVEGNKIWNTNFYIVFDEGTSLDVDKDYVCAQSIEAGTYVNKGSKIVLTICTGKPDMQLTNVIGMNEKTAVETLEKDGFSVHVVTMANDGSHTAGVVNQMSKSSGTKYPYGTEVTLSVWGEAEKESTPSETDNIGESAEG